MATARTAAAEQCVMLKLAGSLWCTLRRYCRLCVCVCVCVCVCASSCSNSGSSVVLHLSSALLSTCKSYGHCRLDLAALNTCHTEELQHGTC